MSRHHHRHRNRHRRRNRHDNQNRPRPNGEGQPNRPIDREPLIQPHVPKNYAVVFYETFVAAKADLENMQNKAKEVDQLNIVIKADGNQWDEELTKVGKLFAGEAWHLIHSRRVEEGWYNEPH